MNTETALIFTVGSIIGMVLTTQLWQLNYFKRENFKIQKSSVMAENRLKLKKLEKEMGINTKQGSNALISTESPGILELLKNIDKDKISNILEMISNKEGVEIETDEPKSDIARILDVLPPSVIEGFISNLNKKNEQSQPPSEGY